ncbi:MAG: NupC/NupG family nucleoside CNT transporter [candidate division KSB1 bacterium]|nr:NupC/NupG family nucleoside CNT transporter [candidate division KSB1 bacterium]
MRFIGILGLVTILGIAFLLSANRRAVRPRVIIWGMSLQMLFAAVILSRSVVSWIGTFLFFSLIVAYLYRQELSFAQPAHRLAIKVAVGLAGAGIGTAVAVGLEKAGYMSIILGLTALGLFYAWIRKAPKLGRILFSILLILCLGMMIGKGVYGDAVLVRLAVYVERFLRLTDKGSEFLFGNLVKTEYFTPQSDAWPGFGFQFAFSVLPTIIFFSACMSILYYLGIMQAVVKAMASFMRWTMGTSGAETLSCSANVFVGQTEAPLLIKPFLEEMTISELHAVMVGGFGTIAGGVMAGYIRMGISPAHLIAASVMAAPASLVMAKILLPETQHSKTAGDVNIPDVGRADNLLDAAARGVTDGLKLAVNVGAMLIAFISLIAFVDLLLGFADKWIDGRLLGGAYNAQAQQFSGIFPGSLKSLLGTLFSPIAFLIGVPWKEALDVGNLLGVKIAVNEFVGYAQLSEAIRQGMLSPRSITIATYALCGFANFSSIGIQLGGIGALIPNRRSELSRIALRAMIGGALVSWMTASIAGMLI